MSSTPDDASKEMEIDTAREQMCDDVLLQFQPSLPLHQDYLQLISSYQMDHIFARIGYLRTMELSLSSSLDWVKHSAELRCWLLALVHLALPKEGANDLKISKAIYICETLYFSKLSLHLHLRIFSVHTDWTPRTAKKRNPPTMYALSLQLPRFTNLFFLYQSPQL